MKKAVIQTGNKQYLVKKGDEIKVELLKSDKKTAEFEPLLVIDEDKIQIGTPTVSGSKVSADIISANELADKVTSIRYKAKKRVRKVHGHRQHQTIISIKSIT